MLDMRHLVVSFSHASVWSIFDIVFFYQLIPFFILLSCDQLFISGGMNLLSIIYSLFIIAEFVSILNSLHIVWFIKIFHKDTS